MLKRTMLSITVLAVVIAALACGQSVTPTLDVYAIPRDIGGTGTIFIWAVANGDETLAMSLVSTRSQSVIAQRCENGKVIACFKNAGLQDWQKSNTIVFLPEYSHDSTNTYSIYWESNAGATWAVLEIVDENGKWRVDGWRGFLPSQEGVPVALSALIDGTDTTNLFPSEE